MSLEHLEYFIGLCKTAYEKQHGSGAWQQAKQVARKKNGKLQQE